APDSADTSRGSGARPPPVILVGVLEQFVLGVRSSAEDEARDLVHGLPQVVDLLAGYLVGGHPVPRRAGRDVNDFEGGPQDRLRRQCLDADPSCRRTAGALQQRMVRPAAQTRGRVDAPLVMTPAAGGSHGGLNFQLGCMAARQRLPALQPNPDRNRPTRVLTSAGAASASALGATSRAACKRYRNPQPN